MTADAEIADPAREFDGPLSGRTVLVTRARHQAASLAGPLEALGAEVLIAPVIETADPDDWAPVDEAIANLSTYDWVVFTSANAVERFCRRMGERGVPCLQLGDIHLAAVGPATAERLTDLGLTPEMVPDDHRAEGLLEDFLAAGAGEGWRFLFPRAMKAREILPDALREAGATVDVVTVYRTVPARPDPGVLSRLRAGDVDIVTFTSPSTVKHFIAWVQSAGLEVPRVMETIAPASIGPVTSDALAAAGYPAAIEPRDSTVTQLVEAIVEYVVSG